MDAEEHAYEALYGPGFWNRADYRRDRYIKLLRGEISAEQYVDSIRADIEREHRLHDRSWWSRIRCAVRRRTA